MFNDTDMCVLYSAWSNECIGHVSVIFVNTGVYSLELIQ